MKKHTHTHARTHAHTHARTHTHTHTHTRTHTRTHRHTHTHLHIGSPLIYAPVLLLVTNSLKNIAGKTHTYTHTHTNNNNTHDRTGCNRRPENTNTHNHIRQWPKENNQTRRTPIGLDMSTMRTPNSDEEQRQAGLTAKRAACNKAHTGHNPRSCRGNKDSRQLNRMDSRVQHSVLDTSQCR